MALCVSVTCLRGGQVIHARGRGSVSYEIHTVYSCRGRAVAQTETERDNHEPLTFDFLLLQQTLDQMCNHFKLVV